MSGHAGAQPQLHHLWTEPARQERDALLRGILFVLQEPMMVLNKGGTIVAMNEACSRWACEHREGFWKDLVIGSSYLDLCRQVSEDNSEPAKAIVDGIQSVLNGRRSHFTSEYGGFLSTDSRGLIMEVVPIPDAPGGAVVVYRDLTERQRAEEERLKLLARERTARQAAEAAGRLKDEFLTTVSHELRTPLTATLGWTRLLRSGQLDPATAARAIEIIERNAQAQAQLIEDLLDVSRIITGKLRLEARPIDLTPVIKAAVSSLRLAVATKSIRLRVVLDSNAGLVSGDPDRLQQVVWNLLSNAIKFTPCDGEVQIRLERVNSHVEIIVSDSGKGIPTELLPYMFERFYQADRTTPRPSSGVGLGLAIVRHLVELHGGTVQAESPGKGKGATFSVRLPLRGACSEVDGPTTPTPRTGPGTLFHSIPRLDGLRVLLVDDEVDTLASLTTVLERCGAKVAAVASTAVALRTFQFFKPDLLVSDIGMPGTDGYELIRRVRALAAERGGTIPAVALTAYARIEDRMRALSAGYQMHVAKPVEPMELIKIIENLISFRNL